MINKPVDAKYNDLLGMISITFSQGQARTISAINTGLVMTYWKIGQHIVEFEQEGQVTAQYGKQLITNLS